jgi:hypothetical protein
MKQRDQELKKGCVQIVHTLSIETDGEIIYLALYLFITGLPKKGFILSR